MKYKLLLIALFNLLFSGITWSQSTPDTFFYTGNVQYYVVPSLADTVSFEVYGAQGDSNAMGILGGLGGYAFGKKKLNAGDTLFIFVGGIEGYNGGGLAGNQPCAGAAGGNGGGASDVRLVENDLSSRFIVAGGGGGAAGNRIATCGRGSGGGGGGGYYGGGGGAGWPYSSSTLATGGTQSAGGGAGLSDWTSVANNDGYPGSFGFGGNGGDEASTNQSGSQTASIGGNGGGENGQNGSYAGNFAGQSGAGGSSYIAGVNDSSTVSGVNWGNGFIVITYNIIPPANILTGPENDTVCSGLNIEFTISAVDFDSVNWEVDNGGGWVEIPGELNDTLVLSMVSFTNNGNKYRAIAFGAGGNDTSDYAVLTIYESPTISVIVSSLNPSINGYAPMQCANLTVSASGGNGSYTYNWSPSGNGNPLNVCPTIGTWYHATVIDSLGCQDTMSFKQSVKNASSPYPGRIYMCHQNNPRRPQYYTVTVNTSQVPYYLGLGATFGPCGSMPSKLGESEIIDLEDIYKIYPNPFNTELNIEFFSLFDEEVNITLTDMNGRELKTLMNERVYEGSMNRISTDASDLPSGMYLIRYVSVTDIRVQKVILNR